VSTRGFWAVFGLAWLAYGGLFYSVATFQGEAPSTALAAALGGTLAPAIPAVVLALRRRQLFHPERSLWRTVGVHLGVGVLYSLTMVLLLGLFLLVFPIEVESQWGDRPAAAAVSRFISGLFLYAILLGFLMWTESLERVQESRSLAAREAMLRAQAEARALRAQFNPHFVFNTLHSLMLLVRADPPTAERAIEDVAALIRYASILQRRGVDAVPLGQELEIARRYAALEKLRLADRLQVEWDVAPSLEGYGVPALSLQTLLENAIKHGVSPRPEGGAVRVRADIEDGVMVLVVQDDGNGADPQVVAAARDGGLSLLEQRLDAVYGADAGLRWRTAPGEGFAVTVRVPAAPAEAVEAVGWLALGQRRDEADVAESKVVEGTRSA
jgi:hypothetical protein